jgi:hypothetical protein
MISFARARRVAACALLAVSAGACATVTRGTNQAWTIQTTPPGAAVKTSNGFACNTTPCTFKMKRRSTFDVTITKDGYKTYHGNVVHQVGGGGGAGMAGNVIVGGLIGAGVDVASGAMMDLKPNPMVVGLEAVPPPTPATPAAQPVAEAAAPAQLATAAPAPAAKSCASVSDSAGTAPLKPC